MMTLKARVFGDNNEFFGSMIVRDNEEGVDFAKAWGPTAKRLEICATSKPMFEKELHYVIANYYKDDANNWVMPKDPSPVNFIGCIR